MVSFYDGDPEQGGVLIGQPILLDTPLLGGATQEVSVLWLVPPQELAHPVFAVAGLGPSNASSVTVSNWVVLPDLELAASWSGLLDSSRVLLQARVRNIGAITVAPTEVWWRLGSAEGEVIGTAAVDPLEPGVLQEVAFLWDIAGLNMADLYMPVYAVVNPSGAIREADHSNNTGTHLARSQPNWIPFAVATKLQPDGRIHLRVDAIGASPSELFVESAGSLNAPISWQREVGSAFVEVEPGRFDTLFMPSAHAHFFRVGTSP
jgi:hypothetical protein